MAQRIEITDLPKSTDPAAIKTALIEIQQLELEEGEQSQSVEIQKIIDESKSQTAPIIDEKIVPVNARIDALDSDVDARISAIDHLAALDVLGLLDEIRPTVETWSSGGGSKVRVLRDNKRITLPENPEIGDSINILVQATNPGKIKQIEGTTLRNADHNNATGVDEFLRLRNNQRLELTYVADELIEDRDYTHLPGFFDPAVEADVSSMALSPDGRYIGLGLRTAPYFVIYQIDGPNFRRVAAATRELFAVKPFAFAFDPENNDIHLGLPDVDAHIILGFDGTDLTFKEVIRRTNNAPTYSISFSFSPDGRYKAEGHSGGTVTITDLTTNAEVDHPWTSTGSTDVVHSIAFSPNPPEGTDQLLAIGHLGNPCMSFLSFSDGVITKLRRPDAIRHRAEVIKSMAWSHDGELLAVNLSGREIVVYDMTGKQNNIATILTELSRESGDKYSGSVFYSVAFSKFKHLGVSWGYNASPYIKAANIYNFENNVVPDAYFKQLYPGESQGEDVPILWTVGGGYFLFGGGTYNFSIYHALKFTQGAWFVSRLDGPEIQPSDFSGVASPAETPEEETKPVKRTRRKKKENK